MKTPIRHLITGLCIIIGAGLVVGTCALWYFHTDLARTQLLTALNQRIPGSVSIQDCRFSLLSGRIDIWNLRIVDFLQQEAARCDHLSLSISWWQLFQGKLRVLSATIDKPRIRICIDPDGALNFSHIFSETSSNPAMPEAQPGFFFPIVVDSLTLTNATLSYQDEPQNLSICLENMDAELSADFLKQAGNAPISGSETA